MNSVWCPLSVSAVKTAVTAQITRRRSETWKIQPYFPAWQFSKGQCYLITGQPNLRSLPWADWRTSQWQPFCPSTLLPSIPLPPGIARWVPSPPPALVLRPRRDSKAWKKQGEEKGKINTVTLARSSEDQESRRADRGIVYFISSTGKRPS